MREIVILGAGGFAREVAWLIEDINRLSPTWKILGHSQADAGERGKPIGRYSVAFCDDELESMNVALAVGVGDPGVLSKLRRRFQSRPRLNLPNLIHPSVQMDPDRIELGAANVICAGTILTTDIHIGSFNILNLSCTVGHDVEIGDDCVLNPGCNISGGVRIGSRSLIGTGAVVLQYLELGPGVAVGAGAVVTKNVEAGATVVGVPARPLARG